MSKDSTEKKLVQTINQILKQNKPRTVKQLASCVKEKLSISENEIIESIIKLQSEGRIKLSKQQPYISLRLISYMKTEFALWYWLTIVIAIGTSAVTFIIPEGYYPWIYLRNGLGTIFVLWLPGYTLTKALFPLEPPIKIGKRSLDMMERIALSFGMSLALVPMVGLVLNYTQWGIQITTTVPTLLILTIVFATAGIKREHQSKLRENQK